MKKSKDELKHDIWYDVIELFIYGIIFGLLLTFLVFGIILKASCTEIDANIYTYQIYTVGMFCILFLILGIVNIVSIFKSVGELK